ncbi:MAG: FHA domain-containing protein [Anaerolineae bacterium]|nr:FHA domain-containing protein [Anaerolineae bacterium]
MASTPTADWTIEIRFPDSPQPIRLHIEKELLLGRADLNQPIYNGFDLTPFKAESMGVSRRHAMIRRENGGLVLIDLNSVNGTILNGVRLSPDAPQLLGPDNTIFLSHLQMTLRINEQLNQLNIRAKRIEFSTVNAPTKAHGQRILTVDDDAETTRQYQSALENTGFAVHVCRDVVSAIRTLNHTTPSLMLLDLALPSIPGLELCRYVRRDIECSAIPIVVVSALDDERSIKQAMEAEVDVYVQKPFDVGQLTRLIAAIVHKSEQDNPLLHTKKLVQTASLDYIAGAPRNDTVVIFVTGHREPICAVVQKQMILGRSGVKVTDHTIIDLEGCSGLDKGVSRNHALLKRQGDAFTLEDIGSHNGTFVNGKFLIPRTPHPIKNGDEIQLGSLRMNIYLLGDSSRQGP